MYPLILTGTGGNLLKRCCQKMTAVLLGTLGTPLDAAETIELNKISSDLLYLLSDHEVPVRIQLRLGMMGYRSVQIFGVWADDKAGVRAAFTAGVLNENEGGLSIDQIAEVRLRANQVLSAWMTASLRAVEEIRLSTDSKLLRLPTMLTRTTLISLRQRYEQAHGRVSDSIFPCASLIEKRLEELEEGTFVAQQLTEIISVEQSGDEFTTISEVGTTVRVRRSPKSIPLPTTTEELRSRMKTLAITFTIAGYKHANRLWIRTSTLAVWADYVEYLLSDKIAAYQLDQEGISIRASWSTVLSYDFNMRKLACRKILYDGFDFEAALTFARDDLACKEQYFITPTAMIAASRRGGGSSGSGGGSAGSGDPKGENKGKGKGIGTNARKRKAALQWATDNPGSGKGGAKGSKAKGKNKGKNQKTPDGRRICTWYNQANGCTRVRCDYLHLCGICFEPEHSSLQCPRASG